MLEFGFVTVVLLALEATMVWLMNSSRGHRMPPELFAIMTVALYAIWIWCTQALFNLSADDTIHVALEALATVCIVLVTVLPAVMWLQDRRLKAVPVNHDDMDGTWVNRDPRFR